MPTNSLLALCAGLVLVSPASCQWTDHRDPSVSGSPDIPLTEGRFNAALQYQNAWMLLESVLVDMDINSDELDAMEEGIFPARYIDALEINQEHIETVIAATMLEECDFGLQYEQGIKMLMPQLAMMRNTAKLLVNDARRLESSDMDGAAQRLAATFRLGEHTSQTRTIIGSLVGIAIADLARVETLKLLDANRLSPEQAQVIISAIDRARMDDPFRSLEALRTESTMMTAWIKHSFGGDHAGIEFLESLEIAGDQGQVDNLEREVRAMDDQALGTMTERAATAYEELIEAWQTDNPEEAIGRVEQKMIKGGYGHVAQLIMPALGNFRHRVTESEENLEKLRERLLAVGDE